MLGQAARYARRGAAADPVAQINVGMHSIAQSKAADSFGQLEGPLIGKPAFDCRLLMPSSGSCVIIDSQGTVSDEPPSSSVKHRALAPLSVPRRISFVIHESFTCLDLQEKEWVSLKFSQIAKKRAARIGGRWHFAGMCDLNCLKARTCHGTPPCQPFMEQGNVRCSIQNHSR